MATLSTGAITIAEAAKSHTEDGKYLKLYDTLRRRNTIFDDMVWVQANMPDKHRIPRRTASTTSTKTRMYDYVAADKIRPEQIDEYMMIRESISEVDTRMKHLYPDILTERDDQDQLKLSDLAYDAAGDIIYGDRSADIKGIDGLAKRMNALVSNQVVTAGGSANRSSIYFVAWDKRYAYGIYPKGSSTFGVELEDMGKQIRSSASGDYWSYMTHLQQQYGLSIQDPLGIARIANIDDTNADPWTNYTLKAKVNQILAKMNVNVPIYAYVKASQFALLQNYLQDKANVFYNPEDLNKMGAVIDFMGIRWRIFDGILNTETAVA